MTLNPFKFIRNIREALRLQAEAAHNEQKRRILVTLRRPMTASEVDYLNKSLLIDSAGWLGGNYTEQDFKLRYAQSKAHMFENDELAEWLAIPEPVK